MKGMISIMFEQIDVTNGLNPVFLSMSFILSISYSLRNLNFYSIFTKYNKMFPVLTMYR